MNVEYRVNADMDAQELLGLFRQTEWADARSPDGIRTMLNHTIIHVSAWHDRKLVGFARAITDTIYRAVIDDVVVDAAYRGRGVGSQLMKTIGAELSNVEEVFLGCGPPVVPFYETLGYEQAQHPYMKRLKRSA